jgi:hypothetical protein
LAHQSGFWLEGDGQAVHSPQVALGLLEHTLEFDCGLPPGSLRGSDILSLLVVEPFFKSRMCSCVKRQGHLSLLGN